MSISKEAVLQAAATIVAARLHIQHAQNSTPNAFGGVAPQSVEDMLAKAIGDVATAVAKVEATAADGRLSVWENLGKIS